MMNAAHKPVRLVDLHPEAAREFLRSFDHVFSDCDGKFISKFCMACYTALVDRDLCNTYCDCESKQQLISRLLVPIMIKLLLLLRIIVDS